MYHSAQVFCRHKLTEPNKRVDGSFPNQNLFASKSRRPILRKMFRRKFVMVNTSTLTFKKHRPPHQLQLQKPDWVGYLEAFGTLFVQVYKTQFHWVPKVEALGRGRIMGFGDIVIGAR